MNVLALDQRRQRAGARRVDLAAALAQFGWRPVKADRLVDGGLRRARDPFVAAEHAVFVDLQAAGLRDPAQRDVVRLRSGEIDERRAERVGVDDTQVDLQPVAEHDARTRLAVREHARDVAAADERVGHRGRIACAHEDVEIADRLAAAPKTAGRHHFADAGHLPQPLEHRPQRLRGIGQQEALRLALQAFVDRVEQLRLGLRAEARQRAHVAALCFGAQLFERVDVQCVMQRLHAFRAEPRHVEQFDDRARQRMAQRLLQFAGAGRGDLAQLRREIGADRWNLAEIAAVRDHRRNVAPVVGNRTGRVAIGAHPERIRALDLEHVGDFGEHGRALGIVDRHDRRGSLPRGWRRARVRRRLPARRRMSTAAGARWSSCSGCRCRATRGPLPARPRRRRQSDARGVVA